jgi:D-alanyl-D-alanine carboxypeptidase/D-alanyl-D-alanine-endopeptidase (penicillin-binding protein 4)
MRRESPIFFVLLTALSCQGQDISARLKTAYNKFENDSQMKHGIASLYVIDASTGNVVFDKNSQVGLAGASTQKIITAATAFEVLGKDFRFETRFGYDQGELYVFGAGDPTLGSWRYESTKDSTIFSEVADALQRKRVASVRRVVMTDDEEGVKRIPGGWIYEDIGNYYGAPAMHFNWHENQYDIKFIPGSKAGDPTRIDTNVTTHWKYLNNYCLTGAVGSGDNAYVYPLPGNVRYAIQGTVPAGPPSFTISAADYMPGLSFSTALQKYLNRKSMMKEVAEDAYYKPFSQRAYDNIILIHQSPSLDSIVYWFLRKSINLYGEALLHRLTPVVQLQAAADSGLSVIIEFWKQRGIEKEELNLYDGSGLSPLNRLTTHAQVEVLKFAKGRSWFPYYYDAIPEFNGMKMKSGTISDVKGFCGYQASKDGHQYIFSFLVNNYSGKTSGIVSKMYQVLDELK